MNDLFFWWVDSPVYHTVFGLHVKNKFTVGSQFLHYTDCGIVVENCTMNTLPGAWSMFSKPPAGKRLCKTCAKSIDARDRRDNE